ncbi:hypothetical protein FA13DRAFT_1724032 [Coprinellus micaceus]|uniref:Uncharacterized protein n=1 Tax=Coprinellus micaceus TaxID=71717 RepID=A0A4Y7U0M5_COPMI|nr:hypothetical protein FA13DRAFT_1724032 [Coprinellus micaceus]
MMERCQERERNYNCFSSKLLDRVTAIRLSNVHAHRWPVRCPELDAMHTRNEVYYKWLVRFVRVLEAVTDLISCRHFPTHRSKPKQPPALRSGG